MCRRTVELHDKFCFTCSCKRCALERSPRPCSNTDGIHHMPSPPAWFLSAMAPAELQDDAPAKDVGRAMSLIRTTLAELLEQAHELFIEEGRAAEAWAVLEAGLFKANLLPPISVQYPCACIQASGLPCCDGPPRAIYACLRSSCSTCMLRCYEGRYNDTVILVCADSIL